MLATGGRLLVALLAAAAIIAVPAGARPAANLAPNAGFENDCAGAPCEWDVFSPGTLASDLTSPHVGARSARLDTTFPVGTILLEAIACSPIPVATYNLSAWFRTTSLNVTRITVSPGLYPGAGCTGLTFTPPGASHNLLPADRDGQWHQVTGSQSTAGGVSGRIVVFVECVLNACDAGDTVNIDDVVFDAPPTAVTVTSFAGVRTARGVRLAWRTTGAGASLGFHVYRQARSARVRVSLTLVRAAGSRSFTYLDRRAPRGQVRYWLQGVGLDGARTWIGPARVG